MSDVGLLGLRDKLYWRRAGGNFHCFKTTGHSYVSLCGSHERPRSGGQKCARPPAVLRCACCDGREMGRREVVESMPESPDWRDYSAAAAEVPREGDRPVLFACR